MDINPQQAAAINKSLIDPKAVKLILIIASEEEPRLDGPFPLEDLAYALWGTANKELFQVLREMEKTPELVVNYAPAGEPLHEYADQFIAGILKQAEEFSESEKLSIAIQEKGVSAHPPGCSGPRNVCLITVFNPPPNEKPTVVTSNNSLLPKYYADGRPTVEITTRKWWEFWN